MPRISLHIGVPKTATSYIQAWLHHNRVRLRKSGIFVPDRPIHAHRIAVEYLNGGAWDRRPDVLEIRKIPLDEAVQGYKDGIAAQATVAAIVSSEYFYYADPAAVVPAVRETFGLDVDVVVYIRSQGDLAISGYNQDVKRLGKTVPRPAPQYHRSYDWGVFLDAWAKELGKNHLTAVSFDLSARNRSLLGDFVSSSCPEIAKEFEDGAFEETTFYNESLPADLLEFKRITNSFGGSGLHDYQWLEEALRAGYTGPRFGIGIEESNQWRAIYRDSNEYVAREYFSGTTADKVFPVSDNREPGVDLEGKLPAEVLAKLLAFAVSRHEDYRKTTNERLRALERQIAALRARLQ